MRNILILSLLVTLVVSCETSPEKLGDFELLPLPQKFDITGVSALSVEDLRLYHSNTYQQLPVENTLLSGMEQAGTESKAQLQFEVDSSLNLKKEGYQMKISTDRIKISGKDPAGLFYGFKTLEQLLIDAEEQKVKLPLCTIEDYPLLGYRAIHLDVKHHLDKESYYYGLIDKLSGYKINAIILEIEDKLQFKKQPKVASLDAWPIEKWKKFSDYAAKQHISISPLVQGLGHASFILKHDEYKELRDDPERDWAFNPLDPKTYEVQFDLYRDAMEATPHGTYLHVGGDEVHTTGRNSGTSALELQLIWLDKVSDFAEKHGRTPIFWDDMPLQQAEVYDPMFRPEMTQREVDSVWAQNEHKLLEFLDEFPKNCVYMRWNYSAPEAYGNTKAMEWFRQHGFQVMGATAGQTRWVLMPQSESNMDNIKSFAVNSINSGLNGLLLTLWDDDSPHFELYTRGIIAFAEYTWAGDRRDKGKIKSAYRHREFSHAMKDSAMAFIDALEKPVAFWKNALLKGDKRNYLSGMDDPMEDGVIDMPNRNNKGAWSIKYKARLDKAEQLMGNHDGIASKIAQMKLNTARNEYSLEVYDQVNKLAHYSPKALLALKAYDEAETPAEELAAVKRLGTLKNEFSALRAEFEGVYEKTRVLTKPSDYILDQDHHVHMANQSLNFDWQFIGEQLFLQKLDNTLPELIYLENTGSSLK